MRLEYTSPEDFLSEIVEEKDRIHEKTVRVRIDEIPEQEECVTFEFGIWMTALLKMDGGEAVMECGVVCGSDAEGKAKATEVKTHIEQICGEVGLRVRLGKIELY